MQNFDHRHLVFAILAPFSYRIRLDTVSKVKVKVIARRGNFLVVYRRHWLWSHQRVLTFKHLKVFISDSSVCNFRPNLRIYKRQKTDAIHPCPSLRTQTYFRLSRFSPPKNKNLDSRKYVCVRRLSMSNTVAQIPRY